MGMFDTIRCEYPLPAPPQLAGAQGLEYQTKDTPIQFFDNYKISADGFLYHLDYDIEDRSDPIDDFTDTIAFYTFACPEYSRGWIEFEADFTNGKLTNIRLTRYDKP
jgi:hypothetical protein